MVDGADSLTIWFEVASGGGMDTRHGMKPQGAASVVIVTSEVKKNHPGGKEFPESSRPAGAVIA
jgi:hypothetical protein